MRSLSRIALCFLAIQFATNRAAAGPVLAPAFVGSYTITDLGKAPGVTTNIGGITTKAGDPNRLLIGGNVNFPQAAIYSIGLTRDVGGHITGFSGNASVFATAPNIDAGLSYGPANVLFATTYSDNKMLQYKPGSTTPDKTINLTSLGITDSTGGLGFVPVGYPGAGSVWISSYISGKMYKADLAADGSGTFNLANVSQMATLGNDLENFAWVPAGSPLFNNSSRFVLANLHQTTTAYTLNASGEPIVSSAQNFISWTPGLGTPVPIGMFLDPLTNDLLISEWHDSHVFRISGFTPVPEPSTLTLVGLTMAGYAALTRRRKSTAS